MPSHNAKNQHGEPPESNRALMSRIMGVVEAQEDRIKANEAATKAIQDGMDRLASGQDKIITAITGDDKMGTKGIVQRLAANEEFTKSVHQRVKGHERVGWMALGVGATLSLFWGAILDAIKAVARSIK